MKSTPEIVTVDASSQEPGLRCPMSVVVIDDFDLLEDYREAWEDLAAEALEPNPFFESWMLIPALRAFATKRNVCVVLVLTRNQGEPALCGVFPLERTPRYKGLPVSAFSLWKHLYNPLCTPLIRRGSERECVDAFLDWLGAERGSALMELRFVSGDGPVFRLLTDRLAARQGSSLDTDSHTRAILRPRESADSYARASIRRDHRKDIRRKTRRLSEQGNLEFNSLEPGGDIDAWIQEFLRLEDSGWKGREGGAFARNETHRHYFATITRAAFERGRLMMLALRLDGNPVAMKCNFIARPGAFAFKIAFNESYASYSPGVMLELENINRFHAQTDIEWMDSCAAPDHPMIDRLWLDRTVIKSLLIPSGKRTGEIVISSLPRIRAFNRKIQRLANYTRNR